jgi:hypothetical protein
VEGDMQHARQADIVDEDAAPGQKPCILFARHTPPHKPLSEDGWLRLRH